MDIYQVYENFKKRWIVRTIYFAAKKQSKRRMNADIISIIRSKRLQTIICCKAAIYAIIPLNNKTIVLSYNVLRYVTLLRTLRIYS